MKAKKKRKEKANMTPVAEKKRKCQNVYDTRQLRQYKEKTEGKGLRLVSVQEK